MSNDNWQSQLTIPEKNTFLDLFKRVDLDNKGIVLKDEAMDFLKKSDIPENILTEFWNATDSDGKGFLTDREFCIILKLIACAQNGIMISEPVLSTKSPLPEFNGRGTSSMPLPQLPQQPAQMQTTTPHSQQQDIVSPEDRMKYINIFQSFGPVNNILNGERAKSAFMRSGLPPAILQNIWNLADTRKSGTLNQTEFVIAMHYIENAMKGLTNLPSTLPSSIYATATGRPVASPLVRNNTLQVSSPPSVPARRSPLVKNGIVLDISTEDFSKYKTYFHQLDTDNSGFVSGADAVVFFKHSRLPDTDLARIWDLADTNSSGQLNEQEFALAMHLINVRNVGGEIPIAIASINIVPSATQPIQQQKQQQQDTADLLGLFSEFSVSTPTQPTPSTPQQQYATTDFVGAQANIHSNLMNETARNQTAQNQLQVESQAVQDMQKQIEQQKEALAKMKQEADEAERQLEEQRKRKEELTKELQMYKQEVKHFATRIESTKEETEKLKKENDELEKQKSTTASSTPQLTQSPINHSNDFFALSSNNTGGLFAKVVEAPVGSPVMSQHTGSTMNSTQPKFDPFSGFKALEQQKKSPVSPSMNQLKEETEIKKSFSPNPSVDITDVESKYPDLSTMEKGFDNKPSPSTSSVQLPTVNSPSISSPPLEKKDEKDTYSSLFSKPHSLEEPKKDTKYGFDFSLFEAPSSNSPFENKSSKDDLSAIFGSPMEAKTDSEFDNIFGNSNSSNNANNNSNSKFPF